MSAAPRRRSTVFRGRVQGVGFRATVQSISRAHRVSGWVRNEADGSVRCIAEGNGSDLDAFVDAILVRMDDCITSHRSVDSDATGEYDAFRIRD